MRRFAAALLAGAALALAGAAGAGAAPAAARTSTGAAGALVQPPSLLSVPRGHRLDGAQVLRIAGRLTDVRGQLRSHRSAFGVAYEKGATEWQASYFQGRREIAQVLVDDASGRVLEHWTGFQVAWTMARGYPGAFGRHVGALYIWLPLTLLFVAGLWDRRRRPWSPRNLDLLVLSGFSISLAFFDHADIYASVPLAYPPLIYLLARLLLLGLARPRAGAGRERGASRGRSDALRTLLPAAWLPVALVFLIGFRVGLNVTDSNVIDVGYAGVIGAQRIADGQRLYGNFPRDNASGDTYGPVAYEVYVPFRGLFGWSGRWDDLPAAHAAAIFFDLLCIALLALIGRRIRGPTLGLTLAFAWAAYPFTLYALESNSNDGIVAALVLLALLAASSAPARGAVAALAGLTKFAPLALAPVMATHGWFDQRRRSLRLRGLAAFAAAFAVALAVAFLPVLAHGSLRAFYDHSVVYQANRASPFSIWGLYGGLGWLQTAVQAGGALLAVALALVPRRRVDVAALAALCGAILIALQLGVTHWFYLYIPWFYGPAIVALLGSGPAPAARAAPASEGSAAAQRMVQAQAPALTP